MRRLVEALGLVLSLASRPGRGSVFSLRLPGAPEAVQLAQATAPDSPDRQSCRGQPELAALRSLMARPAGARPLQGLRVLLVDDEVLVLEGMRALLGAWGCAVQAFKDIDAAAQHVLTYAGKGLPFDLLITDYRLEKDVTGGDVIRAVRDALRMTHPDDFREPPSIIITGDTDPARIAQAQGVGATLLHKPIDTQVLHDELAKVWALGRSAALST